MKYSLRHSNASNCFLCWPTINKDLFWCGRCGSRRVSLLPPPRRGRPTAISVATPPVNATWCLLKITNKVTYKKGNILWQNYFINDVFLARSARCNWDAELALEELRWAVCGGVIAALVKSGLSAKILHTPDY